MNVTGAEAEQTCVALGGHLCTTAEWQTGCGATQGCAWGYAPRGAGCSSAPTASKYCNLGPSFDSDPSASGDQDGLLPTASPLLKSCWADWSSLQGNTATTDKLYDITGNARELTKTADDDYTLMGGSTLTATDAGATCAFTGYVTSTYVATYDAGFRCCFTTDPTL